MERAIQEACNIAGITVEEIDAISGFANGHMGMDALETQAYRDIFNRDIPIFSVRETIGEARAAASTAQVAYAAKVLSGKTDSAQTAYILKADSIEKTTADVSAMKYILAVAAGVGGNYSAVILKKT